MSFQFFLNKKPAEMIGQTIWQIFSAKWFRFVSY